MQEARLNERSLGMDVARAAACAMVVLLHIASTYFYSFGPLWIPSNIYDSLTRGSVPIFFMLSGALLLWKDEPILPFYRKRVLRIVPPLVVWTIVYVYLFADTSIPLIQQIGHYLIKPYGHLWYFYAALGLYASAPFLGRILRTSTENEIRVFFTLWFLVACVLHQIRTLYANAWDPPTVFGAQLFSGYIGYFLLGAYIQRRGPMISVRGRWGCVLAFLVSSAATAYVTYLYSVKVGGPNETFFFYLTPLVATASLAAFAFFTSITSLPKRMITLVRGISDSSLGIYCLHPMIISFYVERLHLGDSVHTGWLKIPFLWLAVFASAAVAIYLLRRIPLMRRVA